MLSVRRGMCVVRARTELHERESTMNGNKNSNEGRPTGLRSGGKVA